MHEGLVDLQYAHQILFAVFFTSSLLDFFFAEKTAHIAQCEDF